MKLIDNKGRLLGMFNIIDLVFVTFFLIVPIAVYYGYKIVKYSAISKVKKVVIPVEIECKFIALKGDDVKLLAVGDKEFGPDGEVNGEITSLGSPRAYEIRVDLGDGKSKLIRDESSLEVSGKIRLRTELKGRNLFYKGEILLISQTVDFKTVKYSVQFCPVLAKDIPGKERWLRAKVRFPATMSEISNVVSRGHIERDEDGRIIGKLAEIISNANSKVSSISVSDNKFIFVDDPYRNDILVYMDILCSEKGGIFYFKDYPVRMGNQIAFASELYVISGIIVGLEGVK